MINRVFYDTIWWFVIGVPFIWAITQDLYQAVYMCWICWLLDLCKTSWRQR